MKRFLIFLVLISLGIPGFSYGADNSKSGSSFDQLGKDVFIFVDSISRKSGEEQLQLIAYPFDCDGTIYNDLSYLKNQNV